MPTYGYNEPEVDAWLSQPGPEPGEGYEVAGIDLPMPNGCWRCIGCGRLLKRDRDWNQCADCDTRDPEDY